MAKKYRYLLVCLCAVGTTVAHAGIVVKAPVTGSTVGSAVSFVATGSSPACSKGVNSMSVYTAPGKLAYSVKGANLNVTLTLSPGTYTTTIKESDNCTWSDSQTLKITVATSTPPPPTGGKTLSNLQEEKWPGYALLPPKYPLCGSCKSSGPALKWSWTTGVSSPSLSGHATKTVYGSGSVQWADAFWNNHLMGGQSTQNLFDKDKTLIPSLHQFTYDLYFWVDNVNKSQAMEFDINQFVDGKSFIWGHECRIDGGHEWDTWNNKAQHWVPSGIACNPISGAWNHLTIQVERTSDNRLLFRSITLNGKVGSVNRYDEPTNRSWYGVTVNYQIDGDRNKDPYTVYIDKVSFTYQ
jgi:hypothetical protein